MNVKDNVLSYENDDMINLALMPKSLERSKVILKLENMSKRILDIFVGICGLIALIPLTIIIWIANKIQKDNGPIFYKQVRVGKNGRRFEMYKFRSMVINADQLLKQLRDKSDVKGAMFKMKHDPRITKVGNFLRKTKLDEIPQIGQVFLGKMSFVGPRPELLRYFDQYEGEEKDILQVRPGITDFSSVEFINLDEIVGGENADEMYEKFVLKKKNALRVKYAHSVSFKTDVYILFKTVKEVIRKAFGFIVKHEHR